MAPMAPILLVVGEAKAELAQALVPCETGAMCKYVDYIVPQLNNIKRICE